MWVKRRLGRVGSRVQGLRFRFRVSGSGIGTWKLMMLNLIVHVLVVRGQQVRLASGFPTEAMEFRDFSGSKRTCAGRISSVDPFWRKP